MPKEGILAPNPSGGCLDLHPGFPEVSWLYLQLGWVYWVLAPMMGFPGDSSGKEAACQCRRHKRHGLDPWVGKIPGEENGNLLQYFCLENPMDRGAWWATVHRVSKSWTQLKQLDPQKAGSLLTLTDVKLSCSVQFSSVAQSCPTLCDPMNRSTPGLPVHHQFPEFTQTHVHRVSDAIQPSHPLSSPSLPAPNPS